MKTPLSLLLPCLLAATAAANTYSYTPSPADLYDLDHHSAYTWRIDNISLAGGPITAASITFKDIRNWDPNPNMLFIHLFDTAKNAGVKSFIDNKTLLVTSAQIIDNFAPSMMKSNPLVDSKTGNTFLTNVSFTMTPTTFTYNFTAAQLAALQQYITNGKNIAFGFDPDCHFWNNGVTFNIVTGYPVPEAGATLSLLGFSVGMLLYARRKTRANQSSR